MGTVWYVPSEQPSRGCSSANTPLGFSHPGTDHTCTIHVVMGIHEPPTPSHISLVTSSRSAPNGASIPLALNFTHTLVW